MVKYTSALYVYDFTLSMNYCPIDKGNALAEQLRTFCKKFIFQFEDSSLDVEDFGDLENINDFDEYINDEPCDEIDVENFDNLAIEYCDDDKCEEEDEEHYSCDEESEASYDWDNNGNADDELTDDSTSYDSDDSYSSNESVGFKHIQGRISLIKRMRPSELYKFLKRHDLVLQKAHFTPSSTKSLGMDFYCCKLQTRIENTKTYRDTDDIDIKIPNHLSHITDKSLYKFQRTLLNYLKFNFKWREIIHIVDEVGATGKSTFASYLCVNKIFNTKILPPLNNFKDIMRIAMSQSTGECYVLDCPRGLYGAKINEFLAGCEELSNGRMWDDRYSYKERWINAPRILLFSNYHFPKKALSKDRWKILKINDNGDLINFTTNTLVEDEIRYPDDFGCDRIFKLFNDYLQYLEFAQDDDDCPSLEEEEFINDNTIVSDIDTNILPSSACDTTEDE